MCDCVIVCFKNVKEWQRHRENDAKDRLCVEHQAGCLCVCVCVGRIGGRTVGIGGRTGRTNRL